MLGKGLQIINRRMAISHHYPTLKHEIDFLVQNRNDETGEEEFYWYTEEFTKPTEEELLFWFNQNLHNYTRDYPTIGKQLEMQYDDLVNGTTTWKDAITAIKVANPKQ